MRLLAALAVLVLALAACGDDSDDESSAVDDTAADETTDEVTDDSTTTAPDTTTTESTETTESPDEPVADEEPPFCAPYIEVSAAFGGEPDPAEVELLMDEVEAVVPEEIADDVTVVTDTARSVLETGDFTAFDSPEFGEAVTTTDDWILDNCEFVTTTEVATLEYEFDGLDAEYAPGRTAFQLVNDGEEAHEMILLRLNDDVEITVEELLALPEEEARTMVTEAGGAFVGPPGATSPLMVDLEPGDYAAINLIDSARAICAARREQHAGTR